MNEKVDILQVVETSMQAVKFLAIMGAVIAICIASVKIVSQLGFPALLLLVGSACSVWLLRAAMRDFR